ncbi:MAG TPA: YbbR-like domain-containing protein [Candidatus Omnitrophota bacterium]|nr:YbbR-like domain-containing protein [Candidatus Omnitrophota bacterium]
MKSIITNNFWAKVVTLAFAVATWFYVFDLMNSDPYAHRRESTEEILSNFNFSLKEVPIKPVFYGKSPKGYRVPFEKVKVEPEKMAIFGPKSALDQVEELRTDRIDLREYTAAVQLRLGLSSDVKYINLDNKVVDVYLPVEPAENTSR